MAGKILEATRRGVSAGQSSCPRFNIIKGKTGCAECTPRKVENSGSAMYPNTPRAARLVPNVPECTRMYPNVPGVCARMYPESGQHVPCFKSQSTPSLASHDTREPSRTAASSRPSMVGEVFLACLRIFGRGAKASSSRRASAFPNESAFAC